MCIYHETAKGKYLTQRQIKGTTEPRRHTVITYASAIILFTDLYTYDADL